MHKLSHYENALHGTAEFPVAYYFVDEHHARYDMPLHWHREWEIIHILRGQFTLFADGSHYTANGGDCFILSEGTMHGGTPQNCAYECLVFDLHSCYRDIALVKKYLRPLYRGQLIPRLFHTAGSPVAQIAADLMAAMQSSCPELSVLAQLSRLLATILENGYCQEAGTGGSSGSRKIAPLKPVLEFIETHYAEDLSLDNLSRIAGMNPKYFCRFFSSITNQTPMSYVNSYRIEQAALLLDSGDTTVTEAAMACGFGDTSYFIKCFKRYRGVTPKQYQKQNFR
ncbi:MAG: helix-turn-helix transcriptional regulator [Lachnospiraceae bacterium]|nr:helix-turn-helix transcriptional regulator [Lachnospiraceae bacterium]